MTRAFRDEPVSPEIVDHLIDLARRAPTAGNSGVPEYLVLEGPAQTGLYWDLTLPASRREGFAWPELLTAPVLILPFVEPQGYVARYSEADKRHTGLGNSADDWSTPYWWVDGGMAAMTILLAAEDCGLGALLFGLFEHEQAVKDRFRVPEGCCAIGAIAVGHPTAAQRPSVSAGRARATVAQVAHRGSWGPESPR